MTIIIVSSCSLESFPFFFFFKKLFWLQLQIKWAIKMTSHLIFLFPVLLDDRSSHESSWECHTAGADLGTDGVSREDAPALHSSLETLDRVETNGIDRRGGELVTLTEDAGVELEEGRSPVEEAGHEIEGVDDDEELGSTVEEGEEAALALDVPQTESDLQWLSIKQASVSHSEVGQRPCESQNSESDNVPEHEEASVSAPESQAAEVSSTREWDVQCPSAQSDSCHSDNLAWSNREAYLNPRPCRRYWWLH